MKTSVSRKIALAAKVACASIGVLPASVLVLAQIDISTAYASKAQNHTKFFRDIAENNPNFVDATLSSIAMLGAHDCLSDGIGLFTGYNTHQTEDQTLYDWASYLGKGAMVRLSRAQDVNVYDQLNAGVRYIDMRICKIDGVYYNSHTLLADTLENNLKLILKWLDENPGEFVVIQIYDFFWDDNPSSSSYESQDEAWGNLKTFIEGVKYNNKNLFDYDYTLADALEKSEYSDCKIDKITYDDICPTDAATNSRKAGAVIFYCSETYPYKPTQYKEKTWYCGHLYLNDSKSLPLKINDCMGRMKSGWMPDHINTVVNKSKALSDDERPKYLRYLQTQTTPNENDIMDTVVSWSLVEKARYHNRYVFNQFTEDEWLDNLKYMPIYLCDNSTCNDNGFNTDVINLLTKYNKTL